MNYFNVFLDGPELNFPVGKGKFNIQISRYAGKAPATLVVWEPEPLFSAQAPAPGYRFFLS